MAVGAAVEARIHEAIHIAIAERRLPAGTRLVEDRLAQIFGVSRARIRKVLLALSHSKLVTLQPNRGACVARPSVKEARDVFAARRVIEAAVIRDLVPAVTPEGLARLSAHLAEERTARDRRTQIKLSGDFHLLLAELAGNAIHLDFLRELVLRSSLIIAVYESPGATCCARDEHVELFEALVARDAERAAALMDAHLRGIEGRLALDEGEPAAVDLRQVFARAAS